MKIIFTKHIDEERKNLNKKAAAHISTNRKIKGINENILRKIITPYKDKMQKSLGKYLITIPKNINSEIKCYLLIASEKNENFVVVSMLESHSLFIKYKNVPLNKKIVADQFFLDDLINEEIELSKKRKEILNKKEETKFQQDKYEENIRKNEKEYAKNRKINQLKMKKRGVIKKVKVDKPNNKNEIKELYDFTKSSEFQKLSKKEQNEINNELYKKRFYKIYKYIDNDLFINEFMDLIDLMENRKVGYVKSSYIDVKYIIYLENVIKNTSKNNTMSKLYFSLKKQFLNKG